MGMAFQGFGSPLALPPYGNPGYGRNPDGSSLDGYAPFPSFSALPSEAVLDGGSPFAMGGAGSPGTLAPQTLSQPLRMFASGLGRLPTGQVGYGSPGNASQSNGIDIGNTSATNPYGGSAPPATVVGSGLQPPPVPTVRKPGWDDPGGLRDQLMTLAGTLSAAGGNQAQAQTFLAPVQQRQTEAIAFAKQANQQAQELFRQRVLANDKRVYDANNPDPTQLQKEHDYLMTLDHTGKMAADYLATKTTAPPIVQHNEDGTLSVYPAGMVPRTTPQPAPAGITFTPLPATGGAAPQAPSPFRTR